MKKYLTLIFLCFSVTACSHDKLSQDNFLVISDIHLDTASVRPMEIQPKKYNDLNDLDLETFHTLMAGVVSNIRTGVMDKPAFVMVLGDVVGHHRSSEESVLSSETAVFKNLKESFPDTPILYTFGNNDSFEKNYGSFQFQDQSPYTVAKANGWKDGFLSTGIKCSAHNNSFPCIVTENTKNGYYAAELKPGLEFLSLNTVLFSPKRPDDLKFAADSELIWLRDQLKDAKNKKQSVLIGMHITPGYNNYDNSVFWQKPDLERFLNIVHDYPGTIIGMLASHTHMDELKVIKNGGEDISGIFLTPALSTAHGNVPALKTFYFDRPGGGAWQLSDYTTFSFSSEEGAPILKKLYDYRDYYDCQNLGLVKCLNHVTAEKMKTYLTAGNPNYAGVMKFSENVIIRSPS